MPKEMFWGSPKEENRSLSWAELFHIVPGAEEQKSRFSGAEIQAAALYPKKYRRSWSPSPPI
jgi:hypothetical protein